jgi:hypothetical protein
MIHLAATLTIVAVIAAAIARFLLNLALTADVLFPKLEAERAGVFYHGSSEDSKARYVDLFGDSNTVLERGEWERMRGRENVHFGGDL